MLSGKRILLAGVALAVFYWLFETLVVDVLIFREGTVADRLLPPPAEEGHELWMRLTTVALILGFAGVLQVLSNRDERRRAALGESEARFQAVIDTAPNAIVTIGRDGRIRSFNASAEQMFGYAAEEAVGEPLRMLMPERFREPHERAFRRYLETGEERIIGRGPVELAGLRKNGEEFPVELSLGETEGREGTLFTGVIRDISGRKRTERELREAEERFRSAFDEALTGMSLNALDGRFLRVNRALCEILGYPEEKLLSSTYLDITPEDEREAGAERVQQLIEGQNDGYTVERRYVHGEGHTIWVFLSISLVRDADGRPLYLVTQTQDITDHKKNEETRALLAAIIESSEDAIFSKTLDGTITTWNRGAERLYGYSAGEAIGKSVSMLVPPDRPDEIPAILDKIRRGETVSGYETERVTRDGARLNISLGVSPIRDAAGRIVGASTIARDVTAIKRAEKTLRMQATAMEASIEGIAIFDSEGKITYANETYARMYGYDGPQDLVGESWQALLAEGEAERFERSFGPSIAETGKWSGEVTGRRWDGSTFPQEASASILEEDSGWVAVARDVTERRAAEEREARQRTREMFRAEVDVALGSEGALPEILQGCAESAVRHLDAAFFRVWTLNEEEQILELRASAGMYTHLDGPHGRVPVGQYKIGLIAQEKEPRLTNDVLQDPRVGDKEWARREGMVAFAGYPLMVEGRLVGVMAMFSRARISEETEELLATVADTVAQGIERKQTEVALREAEERFRALVQNAMDLIVVQRPDGTLSYVSPSIEWMLGYRPEEAIGAEAREYIHPEDQEEAREAFFETLSGSGPLQTRTFRYRHKDGSWRYLEVVGNNQLDNPSIGGVVFNCRDVTERRMLEKRRREAEERYRVLVEQMPALVYTEARDESGTTTYMSPQCIDILGYTAEQWTFTPGFWKEVVHPEDRERVLAEDERTHETGDPFRAEYRVITGGGRTVWVRDEAVLVRDGGGDGGFWQGVILDITDRKAAEEEVRELNRDLERRVVERTGQLRESEERYRLVVDGSNDGIWDWEVDTGKLYWNDRFFEVLGLSRSETEPSFELFVELLHPDDRQRVLDAVQVHLEEDERYEEEFRMRHAGGGYRELLGRGRALRDENGAPVRMAGTVADITERKEAERRLRESEERFRSLVQNASDIITVLDPHGDIRYESPAVERILGRKPRELEGESAFDYIHPADVGRVREVFAALLGEPGGTQTVEFRFRHADGSWRYLEAVSSNLLDEESVGGIVVNSRDVTERKKAEEEVRELNESLEARVAERTGQLREIVAELEAAREAADAANKAKSEFLANMSHEIRTPMNGVIGMTELLLDTQLDAEQREFARTIRSSGEGLLTIINDILDFSKIEAGHLKLEFVEFEPGEVVEEVVGLLAEKAHTKGLELASFVEAGVPALVRGDPGRLRQVLTNIVGNAIKFTEEGEVVVKASLARAGHATPADRGAHAGAQMVAVRLEVRDTGIGMTEEERGRIFRSFTQADASTTRRYGGTGLGLVISKQLVGLMGGEIGVHSEPGVGSTFWFTVGLEQREPAPGGTPAPPGSKAGGGNSGEGFQENLEGLRVLIVDDNATNRQILLKQTASWGMSSRAVGSGPEALAELRRAAENGPSGYPQDHPRGYDVAVLDMQMPGMDGLELAEEIKGDPAISKTRLVMLTSIGNRPGPVRTGALEAGVEAYLTKPVRQSELYNTLVALVSGGASDADGSGSTQDRPRRDRRGGEAAPSGEVAGSSPAGRILLAEDNAVNQKVAVKMLQRLGYEVDVVADGGEALEALRNAYYGAVLMDVQMPQMDGYEATAEIRRREERVSEERVARVPRVPRVPIIAMTANALEGDRERALEAGMDDYISKPVKSEDLDAVLSRWAVAGGPGETSEQEKVAEEPGKDPADQNLLQDLQEIGDETLLAEIVDLFLEDTPPRLAALREAIESGEAEALDHAAHTLRGSSGNLGAARMAALCGELQGAADAGDLDRAAALLNGLEKEFDRVRTLLRRRVEAGRTG